MEGRKEKWHRYIDTTIKHFINVIKKQTNKQTTNKLEFKQHFIDCVLNCVASNRQIYVDGWQLV